MRDWTKIKYYPVSIEKLMKASMREAAYLIAPVNIGEDYEYFDKVKHLLDIPEPRKSIEELTQELDEKIDKLIEKTKRNFYASKLTAERNYEYKFDRINENFEYAKKYGSFPYRLTLNCDGNISLGTSYPTAKLEITSNFVVKPDSIGAGYWEIQPNIQLWLKQKPNWLVRKCAQIFFDFNWRDEERC